MKNNRFSEMLTKLGTVAAAILISLLIGSVFIVIAGGNPISAYEQLLVAPFRTRSNIGELFTNVTPLLIVGVGMAIARHAGLTNLGGEGQMYLGAMGLIMVCTSPLAERLGAWTLIPGILAALLFGGLWGALSGALKAYFRANEIITSLLLNYVGVNLIGYLVRGPLQEPAHIAPESAKLLDVLRLPKIIPSSRAHAGLYIALVMVVLYWFFIYRTRLGYNIRVLGGSRGAAKYSGIDESKYYLAIMALSGAIAGLAGGVEVLGVYYKLTEKLAGSIGFSGVVVALLGMLHPIGIVFAALLMALLTTGSQYIQIVTKIPSSLVGVLQGLIVLFVLYGLSLKRKDRKTNKKEGR